MGRSPRFEGERLNHVVELLRSHGVTKTREILAMPVKRFGKKTDLAKLRDIKLFPDAEKVSMPCLCAIAKNNKVKFVRGKKTPIKSRDQKRYVASLVRQNGASGAVTILASEDRNKKLFPEPAVVSIPHVAGIAHKMGVKLSRGRRPDSVKQAA